MAFEVGTTPYAMAQITTGKDASSNLYSIGMGGKRVYVGSGGTPNGVLTCVEAGEWCWDSTTGKWYTSDTDASTAWTAVN